jgi:tetratricopeptide (TPR) repeat protein
MQNGQVAAQDIDGGFEFNGLYLYDPHYQPIPGKSIWWVQGDTYQIAFGDVPGYYAIKQYSYSHWVPSYVGKVVVLQKNDDAIRHYQEAVRLKPDYAEAHNDLGIALGTVGRLDEAVLQFGEALRLKPRYAEAHYNLGLVLSAKGRTDEAIGQFEQALQAKPDYAEAHCHLGLALCQQGRASEGVRQFQEALRLRPGYVDAQKNLDAALAISGGPPPGAATNR